MIIRTLKRLAKPIVLGVRRSRDNGHLYYTVDGIRIYLKTPADSLRAGYRRLRFEEVFFSRYRPTGTDCVVDFGAGLGHEIVDLARLSPDLRYIAVEVQPWAYECLSLTLAQLPAGFEAYGLAVASTPTVRITPTRNFEEASILNDKGPVIVEAVTWPEFVRRHAIDRVDLLKMNVEGAEAELLEHIDLGQVQRLIVQVHDFRADRGESEAFRTRRRVERRLTDAGFVLEPVTADWIYAERSTG